MFWSVVRVGLSGHVEGGDFWFWVFWYGHCGCIAYLGRSSLVFWGFLSMEVGFSLWGWALVFARGGGLI